MQVGYCRVSTDDQNLDLQKDALKNAGCEKIFEDEMSGAKSDRPGLEAALEYTRKGDVLVVWRLDRLGRDLQHLIKLIDDLSRREVGFKSLHESIDTTTANGKLIFHIFCALAEFERNLIRERTMAGLKSARARGRLGGRPAKMTKKQIDIAKALAADPTRSIGEICEHLQISRTTYYRHVHPLLQPDQAVS